VRRHPLFGPVAPEVGWVPPPSFVLRRDRILRALADMQPTRVLEVGSGAGSLLTELGARGFECFALESSPRALETTRRLAAAAGVHIEASSSGRDDWVATFPLVMAFEVLEHIEDDEGALRQWASWLTPEGTLFLSVPAKASKWGAGDVWAGHFRRYERNVLIALLERSGFRVENVESWGFPLANLMLPVANQVYRSRLRKRPHDLTKAVATAESGVDRDMHVKLSGLFINPLSALVMRLFLYLQHQFARRDLGVGYLVVAKKA
jgi:SAM-dependent methyltransferase